MSESLKLELVTPKKKILEIEVDSVVLPGISGELGILPDHLPLLTTLDEGVLSYRFKGKIYSLAVHRGYAHVCDNAVSVLAELVEVGTEIDFERAKLAESRARQVLGEIKFSSKEWEEEQQRSYKYEMKLKRAIIRQQASL